MNAMTKIAMLTTTIISMGALSACQTTTAPQDKDSRQFKGHHHDRMTPEQREQFKQHRAERKQMFEQVKTACAGQTAGTAVQIKTGDKVINGSCEIQFKVDRKDQKQMRGEHRAMKGEHRQMHGEARGFNHKRGEPMTDAKRQQLTAQYAQRLATRQAQQQAFAKACVGQTHGKAVQIKLGEKTVNGQCQVRFYPEKVATPAVAKVA